MLEISNMSVKFSSYSKGLKRRTVPVIRSLDLSAHAGEIVAIVGQSGAGKSLLAHAVLGILPRNSNLSGEIHFKGAELTPKRIRQLRGREIALIPQSVSFLNPLLKVGTQIARAGRLNGLSLQKARETSRKALHRYGLPPKVSRWFPFQLSGGMTRRVLTATATIGTADLLLADEPTNGLDMQTARETLRHLRELADTGKAVVLITHDIELALEVADKVSIFCGGVTVEEAHVCDFSNSVQDMNTGSSGLRHPYSQTLWMALPQNQFTQVALDHGAHLSHKGCTFNAFCDRADDNCRCNLPRLTPLNSGKVRCWRA
ncbi:ATP-binding cassette domain-containing protein [Pseudodesulfovibrio piezophilus]|uniref:Nickel import system ATP-binding protein NikD n=1 Tax=Pseudodesulfovibrio piezophilus (strain DSM 21447 / JCM 15486 / C1TLV30) TaxID=1322246 RepID=M1WPJ0_PSEP2|nr:ABC transporter ATP-binding protein [Pseudodesulfovibrio piezophilus]CCH48384.1 ATPase [Pseudodesulfovibrio piezophilus C1TLV30]